MIKKLGEKFENTHKKYEKELVGKKLIKLYLG